MLWDHRLKIHPKYEKNRKYIFAHCNGHFFFNPYSWKKLRIYIDIVSVAEGHLGMGTDKQL